MLTRLSFTLLSLQQGDVIAQRLAGRVSPNVAAVVEQLGDSAARRGLPVDPLIQKAIEGAAKAVPDDRITVAVRVVAMQLDTAALALRDGGALGTDTLAVAAGAFAMTAGLSAADITALARVGANPHDLTIGLR